MRHANWTSVRLTGTAHAAEILRKRIQMFITCRSIVTQQSQQANRAIRRRLVHALRKWKRSSKTILSGLCLTWFGSPERLRTQVMGFSNSVNLPYEPDLNASDGVLRCAVRNVSGHFFHGHLKRFFFKWCRALIQVLEILVPTVRPWVTLRW